MQIIKHRQIVEDHWQHISAETTVDQLPDGDIIVPPSLWLEQRDALQQRDGGLGISINGDTELTQITPDLDQFALIAIYFNPFRDGRGYSIARTLRRDFNYTGELRAIGNVLRDQVAFMERVGFDSFEVDSKQDINDALNAFKEITVKYQTSFDEAKPLYQRTSL
jgi:uncharacterized protein (DUF934 family)